MISSICFQIIQWDQSGDTVKRYGLVLLGNGRMSGYYTYSHLKFSTVKKTVILFEQLVLCVIIIFL